MEDQPRVTTTLSPGGSRCKNNHITCESSSDDDDFWDAYMIVALVCFVLGALLLIAGFIRFIWYFTKPRKKWKLESIQSLATSSTDVSRGIPTSASKYSNGGVDNPFRKVEHPFNDGVLRYLDTKPDGPYLCPDFEDTPALWY